MAACQSKKKKNSPT